MALSATVHHYEVAVSDVDRGVYDTVELRLARHPSESMRYLLTRLLAYCLSYEEGLAFSKGGLSSNDEPPLAIHDGGGKILAWIDVGAPSAERLHRAAKAADRVEVFTHVPFEQLRREAATRPIHRLEEIVVWRIEPQLLEALEAVLERRAKLEVMRNDGQLYVTVGGKSYAGTVVRGSLAE